MSKYNSEKTFFNYVLLTIVVSGVLDTRVLACVWTNFMAQITDVFHSYLQRHSCDVRESQQGCVDKGIGTLHLCEGTKYFYINPVRLTIRLWFCACCQSDARQAASVVSHNPLRVICNSCQNVCVKQACWYTALFFLFTLQNVVAFRTALIKKCPSLRVDPIVLCIARVVHESTENVVDAPSFLTSSSCCLSFFLQFIIMKS